MSQKRGDESAGKKVAQGISESLRDRLAQAVLDVVAVLA